MSTVAAMQDSASVYIHMYIVLKRGVNTWHDAQTRIVDFLNADFQRQMAANPQTSLRVRQ